VPFAAGEGFRGPKREPPVRGILSPPAPTLLDYIHRATSDAEIYFVANRSNRWVEADCTFRVADRVPELWDPVSGRVRPAAVFATTEGRTSLPLQFAPFGSMFVVFREPAATLSTASDQRGPNFPTYSAPHELSGRWAVQFDAKWGGPESAVFDQLVSWPQRSEEGIKYYSGTATYWKTFDLPENLRGRRLVLELGEVKHVAEVRLNGKNLGILWAMPFRVDVTEAILPTENKLEIEVVNFWPNRIIGDQFLPPEKRFTRTNIRKLTKDTPLMDSGLLGPVRLLALEP
jgi:hypothetical protein